MNKKDILLHALFNLNLFIYNMKDYHAERLTIKMCDFSMMNEKLPRKKMIVEL